MNKQTKAWRKQIRLNANPATRPRSKLYSSGKEWELSQGEAVAVGGVERREK